VGMKVMVTENLETDLDVTNRARGEIVNIILHPDKPPIGDEPIITLQHLPSYILVKMDRTRATQLEGLDEHHYGTDGYSKFSDQGSQAWR